MVGAGEGWNMKGKKEREGKGKEKIQRKIGPYWYFFFPHFEPWV